MVEPIDPVVVLPVEVGSEVIGCIVWTLAPLSVPTALGSIVAPAPVLDWAKALPAIPAASRDAQMSLIFIFSFPS
jgi:hypothetical protein